MNISRDYLALSRKPLTFAPVTLDGSHVRLEPLSLAHLPQLTEAGAEPAIFAWYPFAVDGAAGMRRFIEAALQWQAEKHALPFAIIDQVSGKAVGSSRFMLIDAANYRAEIGATWVTPRLQRTAINTEAKLLMLQHAFETLELIRVEFKTDSLNVRSRTALAGIGAVEEGTFRNHMITHSGRVRHSVYFSITDADWPNVKNRLQAKLAKYSGSKAS